MTSNLFSFSPSDINFRYYYHKTMSKKILVIVTTHQLLVNLHTNNSLCELYEVNESSNRISLFVLSIFGAA